MEQQEMERRIGRLEEAIARLSMVPGDTIDGITYWNCRGCGSELDACCCAVGQIADEHIDAEGASDDG